MVNWKISFLPTPHIAECLENCYNRTCTKHPTERTHVTTIQQLTTSTKCPDGQQLISRHERNHVSSPGYVYAPDIPDFEFDEGIIGFYLCQNCNEGEKFHTCPYSAPKRLGLILALIPTMNSSFFTQCFSLMSYSTHTHTHIYLHACNYTTYTHTHTYPHTHTHTQTNKHVCTTHAYSHGRVHTH